MYGSGITLYLNSWLFIYPPILSDLGRRNFLFVILKKQNKDSGGYLLSKKKLFDLTFLYSNLCLSTTFGKSRERLFTLSVSFGLCACRKNNVFPVHVLPYFMIWLNCCKYFLWPFYCRNRKLIAIYFSVT